MTRRLVFYVPRSTQLKVMGPVIHHILGQRPGDYEVFALIPGWSIAKSWFQLADGGLWNTPGARRLIRGSEPSRQAGQPSGPQLGASRRDRGVCPVRYL